MQATTRIKCRCHNRAFPTPAGLSRHREGHKTLYFCTVEDRGAYLRARGAVRADAMAMEVRPADTPGDAAPWMCVIKGRPVAEDLPKNGGAAAAATGSDSD